MKHFMVLCALCGVLVSAEAQAGCSKDTDCKGDRVCVDGACTDPKESGCTKDRDCDGDDICRDGACTSPQRKSSPRRTAEKQEAPSDEGGEKVLYSAAGSLSRGMETVGGQFYLTRTNLLFKPHALNVQTEKLSIPRKRIKKWEKFNSMGLVPNGLRIITKDNTAYDFIFFDRSAVAAALDAK